jgi:choline-glycine betaine transporter
LDFQQLYVVLHLDAERVDFRGDVRAVSERYANIKLGQPDDRPDYSDLVWFTLIFTTGLGTGIFYFGVSEPMYYYRDDSKLLGTATNYLAKIPFMNDDQRANMAMFVTFLHWGLHGWATYILVALTLGVVHYRLGRPLTLRSAFYPIVGDYVNGLFGDLIDSMSIACTTFGLCTSLGLGASSINTILHRMSASIPDDDDNTKSAIIWGITALTTGALVSGLHRGVITFAIVAFSILLALIMILFMLDNTWYLANSFTQQIGTYLQYVILGGFDNDAIAQLNIEFTQNDTHLWGAQGIKQLVETALNKTLADPTTYYSSSPTSFMDTWTVFYWAWWITWAPFVGMFYAKISRGRTIRSLILVGMFAPMFLGFFAISVLGSLGIRMQRIAELALGAAPDWQKGVVNCGALGYLENTPVSADAKKLASELGVYALACRKSTDRILDILEPYKNLTTLLQTLVLLGVILFFVTSADAGAFVDDKIAANGMENPPVLQKVWWSITQGATAQALLSSTKNGLSTLQSVSICAALPYTFALNYMCVALFRAMDETNEDPTYMKMRKGFSTSIVDVFENFHKADGTMATKQASTKDRLLLLLRTILNPRRSLTTAGLELFKPLRLSVLSFGYGLVYLLWILLLALSPLDKGTHTLAWLMYLIFTSITAAVRYNLRKKWYIIGNLMDDFFVCFFFYPFALAQMQLEVESHTGRAVEHGRANFVPANTMKAADD